MIYIAKMTTRYPDYHGEGYYNFIMDTDENALNDTIENNNHDFMLDSIKEVEYNSVEEVLKAYPTKAKLNEGVFSETV